MEQVLFQNYKIGKRNLNSPEHLLADDIIHWFNDSSVNFRSIYFGTILYGIGRQKTYEAFEVMRKNNDRRAKYFWGIIRNMKSVHKSTLTA